jgi:hypothetical protein
MPSQTAKTLIALPSVGGRAEPELEVMTLSGYVIRICSQEQLGRAKGLLEVLR